MRNRKKTNYRGRVLVSAKAWHAWAVQIYIYIKLDYWMPGSMW